MTATDHDSGKVRRGDVTRHTTHTARECVWVCRRRARASVAVYGRADGSDSDDFVVLGVSDESDRHVSGLH